MQRFYVWTRINARSLYCKEVKCVLYRRCYYNTLGVKLLFGSLNFGHKDDLPYSMIYMPYVDSVDLLCNVFAIFLHSTASALPLICETLYSRRKASRIRLLKMVWLNVSFRFIKLFIFNPQAIHVFCPYVLYSTKIMLYLADINKNTKSSEIN